MNIDTIIYTIHYFFVTTEVHVSPNLYWVTKQWVTI